MSCSAACQTYTRCESITPVCGWGMQVCVSGDKGQARRVVRNMEQTEFFSFVIWMACVCQWRAFWYGLVWSLRSERMGWTEIHSKGFQKFTMRHVSIRPGASAGAVSFTRRRLALQHSRAAGHSQAETHPPSSALGSLLLLGMGEEVPSDWGAICSIPMGICHPVSSPPRKSSFASNHVPTSAGISEKPPVPGHGNPQTQWMVGGSPPHQTFRHFWWR